MNAFVLSSLCYPESKMKQKVFRLQVADDLVEEFVNAKANADQDVVTPGRRVSQGHSRLKGKHTLP